jgi:hypothetical protein
MQLLSLAGDPTSSIADGVLNLMTIVIGPDGRIMHMYNAMLLKFVMNFDDVSKPAVWLSTGILVSSLFCNVV